MNKNGIKILIVDDDADIRQMLNVFLTNEGYDTILAENGEVATKKADEASLILMDVMMPVMDGFCACMKIRETSSVPIIFLTAKDAEIDQIMGLGMGADDYVSKPFSPSVLSARIRSVLRRTHVAVNAEQGEENIVIRDLKIVKGEHKVSIRGDILKLTPTEFDILHLLARNKGRVFSIEQIYEFVWDEPYFKSSSNTVMVHIRKLREKLEDDSGNPEYLKTEWGVGYKID